MQCGVSHNGTCFVRNALSTEQRPSSEEWPINLLCSSIPGIHVLPLPPHVSFACCRMPIAYCLLPTVHFVVRQRGVFSAVHRTAINSIVCFSPSGNVQCLPPFFNFPISSTFLPSPLPVNYTVSIYCRASVDLSIYQYLFVYSIYPSINLYIIPGMSYLLPVKCSEIAII